MANRGFTIISVLVICLAGCASSSTPADEQSRGEPATCTFCPAESPRGCTLCVESNPLFVVDKDGASSGVVRICNRGRMPATLGLDVTDFHARSPHGIQYPLATVRTLAPAIPSDGPVVAGTAPLALNSCVGVRIDAAKIWQAGLATAELRNRTDTLVQLKAIRYQAPFNLKVDGPTPEVVDVRFTRGGKSIIRLRNEDPMEYRFRWHLQLAGNTTHEGIQSVKANATTELPVLLQPAHFSFFESGFLRSGDRAGMLTLALEPEESFSVLPLPQRRYPVNARLSFFGETVQRIMNYVWVLVVLLAGIVVSLLINHVLPLQKKRVDIKLRLAALEGRLAGLSGVVDSRILNLLRVEKKRLRERLSQLQALVPQTSVELPELEKKIEWLIKRIDLTFEAGELLESVNAGSNGLALPEADEIRNHCHAVLEIVGKAAATPEEIQNAEKDLARATAVLDAADQPPSETAVRELIKRTERIQKVVKEEFREDLPVWQPFIDLFRTLTAQLDGDGLTMDRSDYIRQAKLVSQTELIHEFVKHVEASPSGEVRKKRMSRAGELVKALEPGPDESIMEAKNLVLQVEQNVNRGDLIGEINACDSNGYRAGDSKNSEPKRLMWIDVDPPTPLTYQLVTFRVRFDRSALDCAVAQSEIKCKWSVRSAMHTTLDKSKWRDTKIPVVSTEAHFSEFGNRFPNGWMIGDYFVGEREWEKVWKRVKPSSVKTNLKKLFRLFRKNRSHEPAQDEEIVFGIKAEFPDLNREIICEPVRLEGTKTYVESRTILAVASLVITILIVAFGLLAGAQEKLQTLDWVSGVIAVLVLGFGADTVKNLIART